MIEPGSVDDWLQASLMAGALGGLAAAGTNTARVRTAGEAIQLLQAAVRSDAIAVCA
jgi:hypothetical protein